jgi:hypothetical protein
VMGLCTISPYPSRIDSHIMMLDLQIELQPRSDARIDRMGSVIHEKGIVAFVAYSLKYK